MAPRVMTVSGPIPPEKLGFTLPHEHTGISLWHIANRWDYWELTPDDDIIIEELRDYRRRGGGTLVDLTLPGVGRDPDRLRRLASAAGVNIVMGTGWYREAYYPAEALIDRRSVDDLAAEMIDELEHGVGAGGIRPGIIGEIGTDKPWVSAREERVHRAAARAAKRTGMAITTHGVQSDVGLAQLRIFTEEGVDPARVVIGHADSIRTSTSTWPCSAPARTCSSTSSVIASTWRRRSSRGWSKRSWSCSSAGSAISCCSARTCATTCSSR